MNGATAEPELKTISDSPLPEHFQNSENREIFIAWQQVDEPSSLKDVLDIAIWEKLDSLSNKDILKNQLEKRYNDYVLRLKEEYIRSLKVKKADILRLEAETGGTDAELAKLSDQDIDENYQLKEIFSEKARKGQR